jgi:hypothetical protein
MNIIFKDGKTVTRFDEDGNYLSEFLTDRSRGTTIFGVLINIGAIILPSSLLTDIAAIIIGIVFGWRNMCCCDKTHAVLTLLEGLIKPVNLITIRVILALSVVAVKTAVESAVVAVTAIAAIAVVSAFVTRLYDVAETWKIFITTVGIGITHIYVGLWDILAGIFTFDFDRVFQGLIKILYGAMLIIWAVISRFLNSVVDVLNFVINIFMGIINGIGSAVSRIGGLFGQDWGWHFNVVSPIPKINPNIEFMFESGGFPRTGQGFIAREAGPELVGMLNGRNAVVNNDQIVESVAIGVYGAFTSALNGSHSKNPSIARVFLDGRQIAMAAG